MSIERQGFLQQNQNENLIHLFGKNMKQQILETYHLIAHKVYIFS